MSQFVGCDDESACNYGEEADCWYAEENFDCDGNCTATVDCNDECGGAAVLDECNICGGDGLMEGYDCEGTPILFGHNDGSTLQAFYYILSGVFIDGIELHSVSPIAALIALTVAVLCGLSNL